MNKDRSEIYFFWDDDTNQVVPGWLPFCLNTFLTTGAISQAQHDKSLNCLIEKMGIDKDEHGDVL